MSRFEQCRRPPLPYPSPTRGEGTCGPQGRKKGLSCDWWQRAAPLQADTIPLLAALLSLPHPDGYPPLPLTPQKQKERTQQTILAWLLKEAERYLLRFDVEDLHWADPSLLEFLGLFIEQAPTARLFMVLTFRPEFLPP